MKKNISWLAAAMVLGLPFAAGAQGNPADPAAPAPALGYSSAFSDYKPWQDIKQADWRAVNDSVRDVGTKGGGHASHGAAAPQPGAVPAAGPQSAPPAAAPAPGSAPQAPTGHEGHGSHK